MAVELPEVLGAGEYLSCLREVFFPGCGEFDGLALLFEGMSYYGWDVVLDVDHCVVHVDGLFGGYFFGHGDIDCELCDSDRVGVVDVTSVDCASVEKRLVGAVEVFDYPASVFGSEQDGMPS